MFTNSVSLAWNTYLSWKANQALVNSEFADKALANSEFATKVLVKAEQTIEGQSAVENGVKCGKCEAMRGRDEDTARDTDAPRCRDEEKDGPTCRDKNVDVHRCRDKDEDGPRCRDKEEDTQRSRDKDEDARRCRDKDADATKRCLLQSAMRIYFGWNTDFLSHPYALLPR